MESERGEDVLKHYAQQTHLKQAGHSPDKDVYGYHIKNAVPGNGTAL